MTYSFEINPEYQHLRYITLSFKTGETNTHIYNDKRLDLNKRLGGYRCKQTRCHGHHSGGTDTGVVHGRRCSPAEGVAVT